MTKAKKNNKKVLKKIKKVELGNKDSHKKTIIKNNKTKDTKEHIKNIDKDKKEGLKDLKNAKKSSSKKPKDKVINPAVNDYKNKKEGSNSANKKQSKKSTNIAKDKNTVKKDEKQKSKKTNYDKISDKKSKTSSDDQEKLSKNLDIKASFHRFNSKDSKDLQSKNIENNKKEVVLDEAKKNEVIIKKEVKNSQFFVGDKLIYPAHGVGILNQIEVINIQNTEVGCYLIYFEKEKLSIRVPVIGSEKSGLRALVSKAKMDEVLGILRSGVKKMKGMWSRRAQEYETKINSGDIIMLAEVLRDLTRDIDDTERSYSERIIYETAIYRLATEYSAIYKIAFEEARDKIILTARDKIESDIKDRKKVNEFDDFDFDDFEKNKSLLKNKDLEDDEDEDSYEEEDEDEEEEDGDFESEDEDYGTFDDEDFNDKDD